MQEEKSTKKQPIKDHEAERGMMLIGGADPDEKITGEEFTQRMIDQGWKGCDQEQKSKWLKKNGYEVTRENLLNADLPSKAAEEAAGK